MSAQGVIDGLAYLVLLTVGQRLLGTSRLPFWRTVSGCFLVMLGGLVLFGGWGL